MDIFKQILRFLLYSNFSQTLGSISQGLNETALGHKLLKNCLLCFYLVLATCKKIKNHILNDKISRLNLRIKATIFNQTSNQFYDSPSRLSATHALICTPCSGSPRGFFSVIATGM